MKTAKLLLISNQALEIPNEIQSIIKSHFRAQDIEIEICISKKGLTKSHKLKDILDVLGVGETIDKSKICESIWGDYDYFISRCFDVYLSKYRKQTPNKTFIMRKGIIERTL